MPNYFGHHSLRFSFETDFNQFALVLLEDFQAFSQFLNAFLYRLISLNHLLADHSAILKSFVFQEPCNY
jgi:hypothetical protein